MDITPESLQSPHHKPRWYVSYVANVIPIVMGILNQLLK